MTSSRPSVPQAHKVNSPFRPAPLTYSFASSFSTSAAMPPISPPDTEARAVLRLLYTIAAVPKPGGSILYGDGLEGFGDGLFQDLGSASFGGAEQLLQLRPGLLDRIEIG